MPTFPRTRTIHILFAMFLAAYLAACASNGETPTEDAILIDEPLTLPEGKTEPLTLPEETPAPSKSEKTGFRFWGKKEPSPPAWAYETIEVQAEAGISAEASSYVEAMMLARRHAGDEALRKLADQVAALPADDDGKQTVGSRLLEDPELSRRVEQALRDSLEIIPHASAYEPKFQMTARLPLLPVASALLGQEIPPPKPSPEEN